MFKRTSSNRWPLIQASIAAAICGLLGLAVSFLLIFGHSPAFAATSVTGCSSITATNVFFADYNTATKAAVSSTGSFTVICQANGTGAANVSIKMGNGLTAHCSPAMLHGATKLDYDIFQQSNYSGAFCNTSKNYSMTFTAANTDTQATFTIYPEIQNGQTMSVYGDYQDTMTIQTNTAGADASTTFTLNGHVPGTCTLSTGNMAFGTYTGAVIDATATVTVNCTNTAPYSVALGAGSNSNGASRRMTGPASQYLSYALYSDNSRSVAWGDGTTYGATVSGTGTGANQSLTVYGRVTASQRPTPGSYSDTVVVTLQY